MALAIGVRLGHFTIVRLVGTGGMGEVYEARDESLGRSVAVKVLPEPFLQHPDRLARFEREARLLASLNHPNIAAIYGLEEAEGVRFLVLELVPGETLADVLQKGPMEITGALSLFRQVAEALEAAHEAGVVHRDLKPANLKVTPAGQVKVLDFGLAKAFADPASSSEGTLETLAREADATREGVIVGTPAYMSPEQARGHEVDRRTDVWAFGCCLYEALTGRRPFEGETHTDRIAAVLSRDPDWDALPPSTPPRIRVLLRHCLHRELQRRLHHVADARIEIEEALAEPGGPAPEARASVPPAGPGWRRILPWVAAAVLGVVAVVALLRTSRGGAVAAPPPTRFEIALPSTAPLDPGERTALAFSPDGTRLVYAASGPLGRSPAGAPQLWMRTMDQLEPRPIAGTEGGTGPFFSPDGEWIGFFAGHELKKVPVAGGAPQTVCRVPPVTRGASWAPDGTIVFAEQAEALRRLPAAGGTPQPLTALDEAAEEQAHLWPEVLPGGKAVLFTVETSGAFDEARIAVQPLGAGGKAKVLVRGGTHARYAASGHIVYARAGELFAVPFDLERLETRGSAVRVAEGVSMDPRVGAAHFAVSSSGALAYVPGGAGGVARSLVWVDRRGNARPLTEMRRAYLEPALSPDGRHLAVTIEGHDQDVWLFDLSRGTLTRLTLERDEQTNPVWTRDGRRLALASTRAGREPALFWQPADGSAPPEPLIAEPGPPRFPSSFSPGDRVLAYTEELGRGVADVWLLPLDDRAHPRPFLSTPFEESGATFSPDGAWIAYVSNESGRSEVYVQPYPGPGGKRQISTDGGTSPAWAASGRELFYRNGDAMMSVAVSTAPRFSAETPRLLFRGPYEEPARPDSARNYDVSPDGQRFVMIRGEEPAPTRIDVVLSWVEALRVPSPPR